MLVQPISLKFNNNVGRLREDSEEQPKEFLKEVPAEESTVKSIYSQGMSNVAFGQKVAVKSFFEKEIAEQPRVLQKLADRFLGNYETVSMKLNNESKIAHNIDAIHIVGSGSSRHAGLMSADYIEKMTKLPVYVHEASEFMCKETVLPGNAEKALVIFLSQSGKTDDTFRALEKAKAEGAETIAITNNPKSKIAKGSNTHLYIDAGEENAVAATKTVTSTIYTLMTLGLRVGELRETLGHEKDDKILDLYFLPKAVQSVVDDSASVKDAARILSRHHNLYFYSKGRGDLGAAEEGALKLTETTTTNPKAGLLKRLRNGGKRITPRSSSEALHGTFSSIQKWNPVVQILTDKPDSLNYTMGTKNMQEIIEKRGVFNPIIFRFENDKLAEKNFETYEGVEFIDIPEVDSDFTPILNTIRFQQLTNEICKRKGINTDNGGGILTKFRDAEKMEVKK